VLLIRLAETFYRHPFLVLGPLVFSVVLSGFLILLEPRQYEAVAVLKAARTTLEDSQTRQSPSDVIADLMLADLGTRSFPLTVAEKSGLLAADLPQPGIYGVIERIVPHAPDSQSEHEEHAIKAIHAAIKVDAIGPDTIHVTVVTTDPSLAAGIANAMMHQFVETEVGTRRLKAQNKVALFKDMVNQQETALTIAEKNLRDYVAANPGQRTAEDTTLRRLQREMDLAKSSIERTLPLLNEAQLRSAEIDRPDQSGFTVIDEATVPYRPMGRLKTIGLGLGAGAVLGLVISALVLFVFTVADSSVRREEELERLLGAKPAGVVPAVKATPRVVSRNGLARLWPLSRGR